MIDALKLPLAKLFSTGASRAPGSPAPANPNYFMATAHRLGTAPSHFGSVGAPTGSYPKHWFKGGHPGWQVRQNALHGIATPRPQLVPAAAPPPRG
jgi:hypothetical protein